MPSRNQGLTTLTGPSPSPPPPVTTSSSDLMLRSNDRLTGGPDRNIMHRRLISGIIGRNLAVCRNQGVTREILQFQLQTHIKFPKTEISVSAGELKGLPLQRAG
ncbi:hypothetical protein R6Q57_025665 [Mikania cordata]